MEGPEVHVPHAPHTGHRWWDFAIGGTALLVSLISLYVAIHHGQIMEKLVAANSWPNIEVATAVIPGKTAAAARFELTVTNNGIGPARLESLEIWHAGQPVRNAAAFGPLIKAAGGNAPFSARLEGAAVVGGVLGANERSVIVGIESDDAATWGVPMVRMAAKVDSRVCYCSVFDECYVADTRTAARRPEDVKSCPVIKGFDDDPSSSVLAEAARFGSLHAGPGAAK